MNSTNKLLTSLSLISLLVIIERLSPTTKILLQPFNFLRVHEVFQMSVIIFVGILISFLVFRQASDNFRQLQTKRGLWLGLLFIAGVYFYSTGNGLHEVASHLFNTFCDTKKTPTGLCATMFFNDYYTGNVIYFFGFLLSTIATILLEVNLAAKTIDRKNTIITLANSALFSFTLIAYAAFDAVLVGLWFLIISTVVVVPIAWSVRRKIGSYPFTLYSAFAYTSSAIITLLLRLR